MTTLHYSIDINAPAQTVWKALWEDANYQQWTAVFGEGSKAISDWQEGSTIEFVANDGGGMYSIIEKKVENDTMVFRHQGEIKNGEKLESDWAGAKEAYHLDEKDGITHLAVSLDTSESHTAYFENTFPRGLQIVKQISEQTD